MGHDLLLGFRERPMDLHDVLTRQKYCCVHALPASEEHPVPINYYHRFIDGESARGVWLYHHDGSYPDDVETWRVAGPNTRLAASAVVTAPFRSNDADYFEQYKITRYLRDQYDALLLDPQTGQLIKE